MQEQNYVIIAAFLMRTHCKCYTLLIIIVLLGFDEQLAVCTVRNVLEDYIVHINSHLSS